MILAVHNPAEAVAGIADTALAALVVAGLVLALHTAGTIPVVEVAETRTIAVVDVVPCTAVAEVGAEDRIAGAVVHMMAGVAVAEVGVVAAVGVR